MKLTKRKKLIIAGGALVVIGGLVAAKMIGGSDDTVTIQIEKVTNEKIVEIVSASGRVQPVISVDIAANVSGKILSITAEEGVRLFACCSIMCAHQPAIRLATKIGV